MIEHANSDPHQLRNRQLYLHFFNILQPLANSHLTFSLAKYKTAVVGLTYLGSAMSIYEADLIRFQHKGSYFQDNEGFATFIPS